MIVSSLFSSEESEEEKKVLSELQPDGPAIGESVILKSAGGSSFEEVDPCTTVRDELEGSLRGVDV